MAATIRTGFFAYCQAQSQITAFLGSGDLFRLFPGRCPISAKFPRSSYSLPAKKQEHHLLAASELSRALIELDVYDLDDVVVEDLVEAFRDELDGFQGLMDTFDVRRCSITDESDDVLDNEDGSEQPIYNTKIDLEIWHKVSVPDFT